MKYYSLDSTYKCNELSIGGKRPINAISRSPQPKHTLEHLWDIMINLPLNKDTIFMYFVKCANPRKKCQKTLKYIHIPVGQRTEKKGRQEEKKTPWQKGQTRSYQKQGINRQEARHFRERFTNRRLGNRYSNRLGVCRS